MPDKFIINGQKKLEGEVEIQGSKNAAGAILSATLLTENECQISNLPLVEDILILLKILEGMGAEISWQEEKRVKIKAKNIDPEKIDFQLVGKIRVSVLLLGSLLSRFKKFKIAAPGGDRIGVRPIATHLKALEKVGAKIEHLNGFYYFEAKNLMPAEIILDEFSVTATEILMMVAAGIRGRTILKCAAAEPHIQDLAKMLKEMGVKIDGAGTHTISIEGKEKLSGLKHQVIPDYIEAGTFLVAGALLPGKILVKNIIVEHFDAFLQKLEELGVRFEKKETLVRVYFSPALKATKVQALPYPGFPTDHLPLIIPLLTQAQGKSLVHDPLYENRFNFVQELKKMGADIEIVDPHRLFVFGKSPLRGVRIESWDIRAGASLVLAGLAAQGQTIIENIYQIDRGYEKIEEKLQRLGADIRRVRD